MRPSTRLRHAASLAAFCLVAAGCFRDDYPSGCELGTVPCLRNGGDSSAAESGDDTSDSGSIIDEGLDAFDSPQAETMVDGAGETDDATVCAAEERRCSSTGKAVEICNTARTGFIVEATCEIGCTAAASCLQVRHVSAGVAVSCAVLSDGGLRCWGYDSGNLGMGPVGAYPKPIPIAGVSGAVDVANNGDFICARIEDGTARCWGNNDSGQLGDGTTTARASPKPVSGLSSIVQISVGLFHGCAQLDDGSLRCWGDNDRGQVGDGSSSRRLLPTPVPLANVKEIALGSYHSCARLADTTVWCWGLNMYGQLGDGTTTNRSKPTKVAGLSGVAQISASSHSTCARLIDGTVRCWGGNSKGQLGDGTTTDSSTPVVVSGVTAASSVVLGGTFACAGVPSGQVCWGSNSEGQLGDGTTAQHLTPAAAATSLSGSGILQIAPGGYHVLARASERLFAWGGNTVGQLGTGMITPRELAPAKVAW